MKILLIGYGKMGQTIEPIALERGHEIVGKIDPTRGLPLPERIAADVAIEFTQPESAVENITWCLDRGMPVVVGTTGWLTQLQQVSDYCKQKKGAVFYSSNFSVGVNIFFKLNEFLARAMNKYAEYEVTIDETHHTEKKDAPSGTAISTADAVIKNLDRKKKWVNNVSKNNEDLIIHSFRIDPAAGTHVVHYKSEIDDIEVKHHAHSRKGFANGAVSVAEWIPGKKGMLQMDDFLEF